MPAKVRVLKVHNFEEPNIAIEGVIVSGSLKEGMQAVLNGKHAQIRHLSIQGKNFSALLGDIVGFTAFTVSEKDIKTSTEIEFY